METLNHPDDFSAEWPIRKSDLSQAFETIKNEIQAERFYHGQKYELAIGGFSFMGKTYSSLQEMYSAIDSLLDDVDEEIGVQTKPFKSSNNLDFEISHWELGDIIGMGNGFKSSR